MEFEECWMISWLPSKPVIFSTTQIFNSMYGRRFGVIFNQFPWNGCEEWIYFNFKMFHRFHLPATECFLTTSIIEIEFFIFMEFICFYSVANVEKPNTFQLKKKECLSCLTWNVNWFPRKSIYSSFFFFFVYKNSTHFKLNSLSSYCYNWEKNLRETSATPESIWVNNNNELFVCILFWIYFYYYYM